MTKENIQILKKNFALMKLAMPKWIFCIIGITIYGLFVYILGIALGLLTTRTIETVSLGISPLKDTFYILCILAIGTILACLGYIINSHWGFKIRTEIQKKMLSSLINQTEASANSKHTGDDITTITSDMAIVENYFFQGFLFIFLQPVISGLAALITLYAIDWRIFVSSIIIGLTPVILRSCNANRLHNLNQSAKDTSVAMTSQYEEILYGNMTFRMTGTVSYAYNKFNECNKQTTQCQIKEQIFRNSMELISKLFAVLSVATFIIIGIESATSGLISFTEVIIAINLQNTISNMFMGISNTWDFMVSSSITAQRVLDTLQLPLEDLKSEKMNIPLQESPSISFDNISFAYSEEAPLFSNASFAYKANDDNHFHLITGASGTGKSTLLKLLLQLYTPDSGEMKINGISYKDTSLSSWRHQFSYMSQDESLLHRTIFDNIALGLYGQGRCPSLDDVISVAKLAGAHEFIDSLPQKYDTIIDEDGKNLSVGQKQRILIARALLHNAPILLLDEPTASLDADSEKIIYDTLCSLSNSKLVIVVSHSKSAIKYASSSTNIKPFPKN